MYVARTEANKPGMNELEVEHLHKMLSGVETTLQLCICTEIIDLSVFTIMTSRKLVRDILRNSELKPFQFICNKN